MMFKIAYHITINFIAFSLPFFRIFSSKIKNFLIARSNSNSPTHGKVKFWIHCASLGEYEMAIPVLNELLKSHSLEDFVITFFSPSGYEQVKNGPHAPRIMYLPLDTSKNVRQFYKNYNPQKALFIRYDFWYNFIIYGQKNDTKFYLINGRFQSEHFIFGLFGRPYLKLIRKFENLFTSDKISSELLKKINERTHFVGDTRYDRVAEISKTAKDYPNIKNFKGNRKLLIIGSSWEKEETLTKNLLDTEPEDLAIIIAPHDIKRTDQILEVFNPYSPKRYTHGDFDNKTSVLVLDTIGMLSESYRYADFSLIGGGFHGALHNIIEPAVWGNHISFGPQYQKFPEAQDAIEYGFGFSITNQNQWIEMIHDLLKNDQKLNKVKKLSRDFVINQQKATKKIVNHILT
ncbi:MAG: glycosyltransferase N-terminal domain-containing protein [Bacteroidia bacterium]|nr:glycosyltransferase N-terminal domain-containing protein [Bacteroidia bacterium]